MIARLHEYSYANCADVPVWQGNCPCSMCIEADGGGEMMLTYSPT